MNADRPPLFGRILAGAFYIYVVAVIVSVVVTVLLAHRSAFVGLYLMLLGMPWSGLGLFVLRPLGILDILGGVLGLAVMLLAVALNGAILYVAARLACGVRFVWPRRTME
jgi:hypothetical protein